MDYRTLMTHTISYLWWGDNVIDMIQVYNNLTYVHIFYQTAIIIAYHIDIKFLIFPMSMIRFKGSANMHVNFPLPQASKPFYTIYN